jgi:hypothetical protein
VKRAGVKAICHVGYLGRTARGDKDRAVLERADESSEKRCRAISEFSASLATVFKEKTTVFQWLDFARRMTCGTSV